MKQDGALMNRGLILNYVLTSINSFKDRDTGCSGGGGIAPSKISVVVAVDLYSFIILVFQNIIRQVLHALM